MIRILPLEAFMKKLGVVKDLSYRGDLLVRGAFAPDRGAEVLDARGRALGRVKRVFGPVGAPYVAVKPKGAPKLGLLGTGVYVEVTK